MRETEKYLFFWGSIYSQWAKHSFTELGRTFNTAEQYMMYHKALTFDDTEIAAKILNENDPKEQKRLGRLVKGFKDSIWDIVKFDIVAQGTYLKFSQNENLKRQLLATGNKILVEGSPKDDIWGVALHYSDDLILDEKNWKGQNLLGKALMNARTRLRSEGGK